jgi:hypothetical protein
MRLLTIKVGSVISVSVTGKHGEHMAYYEVIDKFYSSVAIKALYSTGNFNPFGHLKSLWLMVEYSGLNFKILNIDAVQFKLSHATQ